MSLYEELKRRNVIRVAVGYVVSAWLVIQVVETIFPAFGFGDEAVRIVVIVLGVAFVPVLVLAWVFEWTPQGLKKDADVDRGMAATAGAYKNFDRVVMAILAIAVGFFAFDKFVLDPARDAAQIESARQEGRTEATVEAYGEQSIAVIPFLNLSSDPEQAFFADGVAEEVLNLLAKIPELRVISRSSSFTFRGPDLNVPEIAEKLNVTHILEGSVRAAGNRIRITAQLIEAQSDTHLWSETYDRTLDDLFAVQDEIAENIVENLHIELVGPIPKARRTDPRALAMLIQAKQIFYDSTTQESYGDAADRMDALLEAALEIDPKFTDAMFWKGFADWARVTEGDISYEEYRRRMDQMDEAVLAIEPEHAGVLWGQAWSKAFRDVDYRAAAPLFERAYRSAPNDSEMLRQVGRFASMIERFDISTPLYERAVSLDPLCTMCLYHLSRNYMYAREWDEAEDARERFLLIGGGGGYYNYGTIKLMQGDAEAALENYKRHKGDGQERAGISMALYALGRNEESDAVLASLIESGDERWSADVAAAFAFRKNRDAAFEWLEKALAMEQLPHNGRLQLIYLLSEPLLQNLHDDPRWEEFREKVGVPTELIESLEFSIDIPH